MSNSRNEYYKAYNKEKMVRVSLNLSKTKDKDIIQAIDREIGGNKQASIKKLVRKGIKFNQDNVISPW